MNPDRSSNTCPTARDGESVAHDARRTSGGARHLPRQRAVQTHHLTISVRGRRTLARTEAERRLAIHAVVATGRARLLLFCLVDDHLHALLRGERIGLLARDIRATLARLRKDLELKPPHLDPVTTRAHTTNVLYYLLGQPARHGLSVHPALHGGSCFLDLVGARLLPGFDPTGIRSELPRLQLRELFRVVGLQPVPLVPATDAALLPLGVAGLARLAATVFAVDPEFGGRAATTTRARALAATTARRMGLRLCELADPLRVTRQAASLLARRPVDPRAELALRRLATLEERARGERGHARSG